MKEQRFQEIGLTIITHNPVNPRQSFEGPAFDDLVASVREKSVIQPILVRPAPGKAKHFEIVAASGGTAPCARWPKRTENPKT